MANKILKLVSILLTCCVATSAMLIYSPNGMIDEFTKLEQWLEQRFRKETYPADALKAIVNETAQSSGSLDADLRNAMHIIVELSNQKQSGCDDRTLELARIAVQESDAISVDNLLMRVARLLIHFGNQAVEQCETYMEDKFNQLLTEWEQNKQVGIANVDSSEMIHTSDMSKNKLARLIVAAGKEDPKKDVLNYIFDKYFRAPCKQHNDIFDKFYRSFFAVTTLKHTTGQNLDELERKLGFENDFERYCLCRMILSLDDTKTARILTYAQNQTNASPGSP